MTIIKPPQSFESSFGCKIFLAGSIEMDTAERWATDDGTKKSLKGLLYVGYTPEKGYYLKQEVTREMEDHESNMLQSIYENGVFHNQTTLTEVRKRIIQ